MLIHLAFSHREVNGKLSKGQLEKVMKPSDIYLKKKERKMQLQNDTVTCYGSLRGLHSKSIHLNRGVMILESVKL